MSLLQLRSAPYSLTCATQADDTERPEPQGLRILSKRQREEGKKARLTKCDLKPKKYADARNAYFYIFVNSKE